MHRGRGPLKTTMDVINAAKKISEAGINLDKLTRQIADQCPESSTKKDLLAYLQRIALYCHQLNITSKVKADVQNISGELIVSGVNRCYMQRISLKMLSISHLEWNFFIFSWTVLHLLFKQLKT